MRIVAKFLIIGLVALGGALALVVALLRQPTVGGRVARAIAGALSDENTTVVVSGLGGDLPFAAELAVLEIRDTRGAWLRAEGLSLEIAALPLLRRHVRVQSLTAERVVWLRLPEPDDEPFVLKPLRLTVEVDRLHAASVELGRELLRAGEGPDLAAPVSVEAHGVVDLRRLTLDAEAVATTGRLDDLLRPLGVESSAARASVRAQGALAAPGGTLTFSVGEPRRGPVSARGIDIRADVERLGSGERRYGATLVVRVTGLEGEAGYLAHLGRSPTLRAQARFGESPLVFDLDALRLEGASFGLELAAASEGDDRIRVSQSLLTVPDVSVVPEIARFFSGGVFRLRGAGDFEGLRATPRLRAELAAEAFDLEPIESKWRALAIGESSAAASVTWERGGRLVVAPATVATPALDVRGQATLASNGAIAAEAVASAADLSLFSELASREIAGAAEAELGCAGTWDALEVAVTLRPRALRVDAAAAIEGEASLRARRESAGTSGRAEAQLRVADTPVRVEGDFRYGAAERSLALDAVRASAPGVEAGFVGVADVDTRLARGRVTLEAPNLSAAGQTLGLPLAGELRAGIELDHDGRTQGGRLSVTATNLQYADIFADAFSLEASRSVERGDTRFRADARGRVEHPVSVALSGTYRGDLERGAGDVEDLALEIDGRHSVRARRPLRIAVDAGVVALEDWDLDVDGGRVAADWRGDWPRGNGRVVIADLPLRLLDLVLDRPKLAGVADGEISRTRPGQPLTLQLRTRDAGAYSGTRATDVLPFEFEAAAEISADRTRGSLSLQSRPQGSQLSLALDAPVGIESTERGGAVRGQVSGVVAAPLLAYLALPPEDRASGELALDFSMAGTLERPRLRGAANGRLRYVGAATGMELGIDEVAIRADGDELVVTTLRGGDGKAGRFEGGGRADLGEGWGNAVYDFRLSFRDLLLARIDELTLRGDGNVALTGRGGALGIAGDFAAREALVRIPTKLPPDITTLPVEHVHLDSARWNVVAAEDEGALAPIALDITLRFPSRLRVEDPNLDSEWRGQLVIRGDTHDVAVGGALEVTRGTIALGGVRFRTQEGRLTFDEAEDVPIVNVTALASRNDIEATLRMSGRLDRLSFSLTSSPPLPQDEILSRLMFGSSATTLTAGQAVQLAQAAARLSGHGDLDLLARVRRVAGVDRIEIRETEGADGPQTAVSVGKYLHDRVYVSVEQAVEGEGGKARVEVEVTKNITAETEVGQDENARIGLNWRWHY